MKELFLALILTAGAAYAESDGLIFKPNFLAVSQDLGEAKTSLGTRFSLHHAERLSATFGGQWVKPAGKNFKIAVEMARVDVYQPGEGFAAYIHGWKVEEYLGKPAWHSVSQRKWMNYADFTAPKEIASNWKTPLAKLYQARPHITNGLVPIFKEGSRAALTLYARVNGVLRTFKLGIVKLALLKA